MLNSQYLTHFTVSRRARVLDIRDLCMPHEWIRSTREISRREFYVRCQNSNGGNQWVKALTMLKVKGLFSGIARVLLLKIEFELDNKLDIRIEMSNKKP